MSVTEARKIEPADGGSHRVSMMQRMEPFLVDLSATMDLIADWHSPVLGLLLVPTRRVR